MASRAQPPLWRETVKAGAARSGALIGAIAIVIAAILVLVSLVTYHSGDPSLNTASGGPAENWLGIPGAWTADSPVRPARRAGRLHTAGRPDHRAAPLGRCAGRALETDAGRVTGRDRAGRHDHRPGFRARP